VPGRRVGSAVAASVLSHIRADEAADYGLRPADRSLPGIITWVRPEISEKHESVEGERIQICNPKRRLIIRLWGGKWRDG
jgi:hypothetical protein